MSNEWELVVKGGKHKPQSKISNKEQRRINQNNLNSNKYRLAFDEDTDKSLSPEQDKISNKPKPKKPNVVKSEDDINKQINKINSESIKKIYSELLEKFPNQYTVSLLDLAVHISLMIKASDEVMKTINYDQIDFPYAFLSNETKTVLKNIFNKLSNAHVNNFLKSAMIQFLDDHDKGVQSIGLRILIQSCVRIKSSVFITNRKDYFDLLNHYREQTVKFKLLTWVIRQACSNYNMACQIWLIYFLPFITQKCHTEFVINFGEEMRNYSLETTGNDTSLLVTDFVPIIDLIFTQNTDNHQNDRKSNKRKQANFQLTPNQIDRLKAIYPKIKDQAFLSKTSGTLKDYFGSLFLRLSANNRNALLNKELLDCLDHCLKMCPESINHLSYLHIEYPQQTRIFLDHLSIENSSSAQSIKKSKLFKSVMDKIHSTTLAAPQRSGDNNIRKMKKSRQSNFSYLATLFRWFGYFIMTLMISIMVMWTIVYFKSPNDFMQIRHFIQPRVHSFVEFVTPAYQYCETQFFEVYKHIQPYVEVAWHSALVRVRQLVTVLKPFADNVSKTVLEAFHYVIARLDEIFPNFVEQLGKIFQSTVTYLTQLCRNVFNSSIFQSSMEMVLEMSQWTVKYSMELIRNVSEYLNSLEFQNSMKGVNEVIAALLVQLDNVYRNILSSVMKMVGN